MPETKNVSLQELQDQLTNIPLNYSETKNIVDNFVNEEGIKIKSKKLEDKISALQIEKGNLEVIAYSLEIYILRTKLLLVPNNINDKKQSKMLETINDLQNQLNQLENNTIKLQQKIIAKLLDYLYKIHQAINTIGLSIFILSILSVPVGALVGASLLFPLAVPVGLVLFSIINSIALSIITGAGLGIYSGVNKLQLYLAEISKDTVANNIDSIDNELKNLKTELKNLSEKELEDNIKEQSSTLESWEEAKLPPISSNLHSFYGQSTNRRISQQHQTDVQAPESQQDNDDAFGCPGSP